MSPQDRAAQFSPYSAVVGYGDMVQEEARETGAFAEPGEKIVGDWFEKAARG